MVVSTITTIQEAGAVGNMASEIATTLRPLVYQNHLQVFLLNLLRLRGLRWGMVKVGTEVTVLELEEIGQKNLQKIKIKN